MKFVSEDARCATSHPLTRAIAAKETPKQVQVCQSIIGALAYARPTSV